MKRPPHPFRCVPDSQARAIRRRDSSAESAVRDSAIDVGAKDRSAVARASGSSGRSRPSCPSPLGRLLPTHQSHPATSRGDRATSQPKTSDVLFRQPPYEDFRFFTGGA
jgi:hypothetical protein